MQSSADGYSARGQCAPCSSGRSSRLTRSRRERLDLLNRVAGARPLSERVLEAPASTCEGAPFALRVCAPSLHLLSPLFSLIRYVLQLLASRLPSGAAGAVGAWQRYCAFPRSPSCQVSLLVRHPWVDQRTSRVEYQRRARVSSSPLSCSHPGNSARPWREGASLASLVLDVQASLSAHSHAPLGHAFPSAAPGGPSSAAQLSGQLSRKLSLDGSAQLDAALDALSNDELRRCIVEPETALLPLLAALAATSEASDVISELQASNLAAAQANIALAEEAANLRSALQLVRSTDFAEAQKRNTAACAAATALRDRCSTSTLLRELQALRKADEEEGDEMERKLVSGEVGAEAFVKAYKPLRARVHVRGAKAAAVEEERREAFRGSLGGGL